MTSPPSPRSLPVVVVRPADVPSLAGASAVSNGSGGAVVTAATATAADDRPGRPRRRSRWLLPLFPAWPVEVAATAATAAASGQHGVPSLPSPTGGGGRLGGKNKGGWGGGGGGSGGGGSWATHPRGGSWWVVSLCLAAALVFVLGKGNGNGRGSSGGGDSGDGSGGGGGVGGLLAALSPIQREAVVTMATQSLAAADDVSGGNGIGGGGIGPTASRRGLVAAAVDGGALAASTPGGNVRGTAAAAGGLGTTMDSDGRDPVAELARWTDSTYARSRLRVYVYDLPEEFNEALVRRSHEVPPRIRDPLCDASFYSAEVSLHRFLLTAPVRTLDPDDADFFYVPIYTTCYLMTHLPNNLTATGAHFAAGMDRVIREYPYFNRSGGRDHVYTFAQGFGGRHAGDWRRIRNGIFLVHNGEWTADEFTSHKDIVLPADLTHYLLPVYVQPSRGGAGAAGVAGGTLGDDLPTAPAAANADAKKEGFRAGVGSGGPAGEGGAHQSHATGIPSSEHGSGGSSTSEGAVSRAAAAAAAAAVPVPKTHFLLFGGQVLSTNVSDERGSNYSGGVRQYVMKHLAHLPGYRLTGVRSRTYLTDLANARFCLCPEGWHPWSPRPVYAVLSGCIPVVVSERQELPLSNRVDWDAFTVWVRPAHVAGLDAALRAIPDAEVAARQAAMRSAWRALWYGSGGLAQQGVLAELAARKGHVRYRRGYIAGPVEGLGEGRGAGSAGEAPTAAVPPSGG